jgi:glucosamine kinase
MAGMHYFCVDAGATRSRGRLYDVYGHTLAYAEAGPANASYDRDQAVASVLDLWRTLSAAIGQDVEDFTGTTFSIGGAGLYVEGPREAFLARCPGFASVIAMSDGYAALIGAGNGEPCALLTIGTGVAGHRLFEDGTSIQRDAWGWIVGDRGGGAWLGTQAVRHTLEVRDGIARSSLLSRAVMDKVGGIQGILDGAFAGLHAQRLASFAPLVLDSAEGGCPISAEILSRGLDYLAALVDTLRCAEVPLYLNGGLAALMEAGLKARVGHVIHVAQGDALAGCLLVAQGRAPAERMILD